MNRTSLARQEIDDLKRQVADLEERLAEREEPRRPEVQETLLLEAEEMAHLGTWTWDVTTDIITWSAELYRILGYDRATDQPSADAFFDAIHAKDRAAVRAIADEVIAGGRAPPVSFRIDRPGEPIREVMMHGVAVRDERGDCVRFVGTIMDITERRKTERELRRRERLLNEAQRIAEVGSWLWDLLSGRVEWSDELYRICGVTPDTQPTLGTFFDLVHPQDLERVRGGTESAARTGVATPIEYRIIRPSDGSTRHVYGVSQAIRNDTGKLTGYFGTILDITDRRRLEEQLARASKMEAVGRLAGGVAHDFNNILTVITGYADVLRTTQPSPDLDHIISAAESATSLTRRLLTLSRNAALNLAIVDVNDVTTRAIAWARRLVGDTIEVLLETSETRGFIRADENQLQHVLINLAVNARDAMPGGGRLVITTEIVELDADAVSAFDGVAAGSFVRISVEDNGIGMDQTTLSRAFEPFFTTKKPGRGTGLGLATVFGTVTQVGGLIDIRSEVGEGTTVDVSFPLVDRPADELEASPRS